MTEFTKQKMGFALALLGTLFALHPFLDRFADRGFLYLGYDLKLFYAYSLTAGLLSLSVYLYGMTLLNDRPHSLLEKAGKKKEAQELYTQTLGRQEAALKDFPDSPLVLNQMAWLAACCKRDLAKAAGWAKKAVELSPKTPAYQDTLAEVLFQQGKKAEAVAAQKKAVALDPKRKYFQAQLKRLEAGDPMAPLPVED